MKKIINDKPSEFCEEKQSTNLFLSPTADLSISFSVTAKIVALYLSAAAIDLSEEANTPSSRTLT